MVGALGYLRSRADTQVMIAKTLWRTVLRAVCLLALVTPDAALAQAGSSGRQPGDRARVDARRHFEQGLALARSRDWDAALAEFLTSRELFPTRSATRNAAVVLRELGRFSDALYLYDALLGDFRAAIPKEEVEAFRSERRALLDRVGELQLVVEQSGVDISVDGHARGATPASSLVYLEPGVHQLRLSRPGLVSLERQVSVPAGRRETLVVKLEQGVGEVFVRTDVPGATVYVDGVFVGQSPWRGRLAGGSHVFEVAAPGHQTFRESVVLEPSKQTQVAVTLVASSDATRPRQVAQHTLYVEPQLGMLLGWTLGGSADAACDCARRSHPFGWVGLLRAGYELSSQFAVDVAGGYLSLGESVTRKMVATGETGSSPFVSRDFHDSARLDGPLAAVGVSARFFSRFPVTARISGGVAVLRSRTTGSGSFVGELEAGQASSKRSGTLQIPEPQRVAAAPIVASELRIGRRLGPHISADIGLALFLLLPSRVVRAERVGVLNGEASSGAFTLPDELLAGPFLSLAPAVGARLSF
jgi:hypothetical protein